eukprot:EC791052.1.p2 GENE.EC791052.1~~EC791052.1.p2  ORF type:complete len:108 (-),score=15.33 EC791052.1:147-470(-)
MSRYTTSRWLDLAGFSDRRAAPMTNASERVDHVGTMFDLTLIMRTRTQGERATHTLRARGGRQRVGHIKVPKRRGRKTSVRVHELQECQKPRSLVDVVGAVLTDLEN